MRRRGDWPKLRGLNSESSIRTYSGLLVSQWKSPRMRVLGHLRKNQHLGTRFQERFLGVSWKVSEEPGVLATFLPKSEVFRKRSVWGTHFS